MTIPFYYIDGEPQLDYDYDWMYQQARDFLLIDPIENPKTAKWLQESWMPVNAVIKQEWNPVNGEYTQYSIDYSQQMFAERVNFKNDLAFSATKTYLQEANRSLLVYVGKGKKNIVWPGDGKVHKHFHTPRCDHNGKYLGPRMTATVIIPINIIDPVTEVVCFAEQDIQYDDINIRELMLGWEQALELAEIYNDTSNVTKIKFPELGKYLVFYFDSSKYLHWTEADTRNEFVCLVHDF